MIRQRAASRHVVVIAVVPLMLSCAPPTPHVVPTAMAWGAVPPSVQIPLNVERLTVLFPNLRHAFR
jgi:hypothetical protein